MAKASTIQDTFDSGALGAQWTLVNSGQVAVTNKQVVISNVNGGSSYGIINSTATYDLTASAVFSQLVAAGSQSMASWQAQPVFIKLDANNMVCWYINSGFIHAQKAVAGAFSDVLGTTAYDANVHKWFMIRESGGTIFWDFSTDGQKWTNYTSLANPFAITAISPTMQGGTYNPEASTTSCTIDNFNVSPAHGLALLGVGK